MIEEELVRKSRKVSAGLFLDKFWEMESRNLVRVLRDAAGKEDSAGRIGEYHHFT